MPAVCQALLVGLNAACPNSGDPYDLTLTKPVKGLAIPVWEPIAITPDVMRILENAVRGRFGAASLSPLPMTGGRRPWEVAPTRTGKLLSVQSRRHDNVASQ